MIKLLGAFNNTMSADEYPVTPPHLPTGEDAKTPPPGGKPNPNRPSSPDPNCAICLGELENMSYTDSCFHKFCFLCLKEWSKVWTYKFSIQNAFVLCKLLNFWRNHS